MRQIHLKIICTGPESTGKSHLSRQLAQHLGTQWVPEFARPYLTHLGRPYTEDDLDRIWVGQTAWETWGAAGLSPGQPLVCDTDWTVLEVWRQYVFGKGMPQPRPKLEDRFYLLCCPDLPWEPDPLREHPQARQELLGMYQQLLESTGARYALIQGEMRETIEGIVRLIDS
jgi:nicotinamide riboside kinase